MKQGILLGMFMLLLTPLFAQEVCDNGVDDDGDGMVDLNDPECICTGIEAIVDVSDALPNASFETFDCCPTSFSQMNCCTSWEVGTTATTDFMHTCGFVMPGIIDAGLTPFPGGEGIVGAIYANGWQEYLSGCLNTTLQAGNDFALTFQVASAPINNNGTLCNGGIIDYGPIDITLYGNTTCNLFVATTGCPSGADPNWVAIGSITYNPVSAWQPITITFTAPFDVNAIMLGSPCNLPNGYSGSPCYPYFVYDDLMLEGGGILTELEITELGLPCDLDYGFFAEIDHVGGSWQWFFEGVALSGENAQDFFVQNNNWQSGTYQVVYSFGGECVMDSITVYIPPRDTATEEVFFCPNTTVSCAGETFFIPGVYEVVIPLPSGCDSIVECVVTEYILPPVTNIDIDTCGPVEIKVCGEVFSATGEYYIYCLDWHGCDSIIILNLRVMEPNVIIAPPQLLECGPNSDVVLDGSGSPINPLPNGSTTYEWLGAQDGFVGATDEPWAFVNKTGQFCLVISHESNGVVCTDTACVTVQSAKATPDAPLLTGNFFGCAGDTSIISRHAVGTILASGYDWIIPPGVIYQTINDSTLLYIHTTPGSAQFCARAVNECGSSDTTCILVSTGLPTDTLINSATCDPLQAGIFMEQLVNQYGCDSTVTKIVALSPSNVTNLTATTCSPQMAGIDTLILQNQFGCDSLVILTTSLLPSNLVNLTFYTCDIAQQGLDTLNLFNQFGCDSTVYIERIYTGVYQETNTLTICGSGSDYVDTLIVTTGICDSFFLTAYQFLPLDSTWLTASTCDPTQVGTTVNLLPTSSGCDSAIILTVSLLPSDQTLVSGVTCDINDEIFQTITLQNQYGCDSIVTISIQYVGIDTQYVQKASCDPSQIGTVTQAIPGLNCDTIRVTTTSLLLSSQSQETISLCANSGPARDTLFLQNVNGCDSLHIRNFEYTQLVSQIDISPEQCLGEHNGQIVVTDMQGGTLPYEYRLGTGPWQSSSNFSGLTPGIYSLEVRDGSGCMDTLSGLIVATGSVLTIEAGPNRVGNEGDLIDLNVQASQQLAQVQWSATDPINCATCPLTTLGPLSVSQLVTVTGQTANGCSASDLFEIQVRIEISVFIPNSFSPDGDGINDIFSIYGNKHVKSVRNLAVYDRWGNALYSREDLPVNNPNEGWNGYFRDKIMDPGVYVYVVEVELLNGEIRLYKGDITLISKGKF